MTVQEVWQEACKWKPQTWIQAFMWRPCTESRGHPPGLKTPRIQIWLSVHGIFSLQDQEIRPNQVASSQSPERRERERIRNIQLDERVWAELGLWLNKLGKFRVQLSEKGRSIRRERRSERESFNQTAFVLSAAFYLFLVGKHTLIHKMSTLFASHIGLFPGGLLLFFS